MPSSCRDISKQKKEINHHTQKLHPPPKIRTPITNPIINIHRTSISRMSPRIRLYNGPTPFPTRMSKYTRSITPKMSTIVKRL